MKTIDVPVAILTIVGLAVVVWLVGAMEAQQRPTVTQPAASFYTSADPYTTLTLAGKDGRPMVIIGNDHTALLNNKSSRSMSDQYRGLSRNPSPYQIWTKLRSTRSRLTYRYDLGD